MEETTQVVSSTTVRSLPPGTRIKIDAAYSSHTGTVKTAFNYESYQGDDWYIEMESEHDGLPMYWKQRLDFGTLTVLTGTHMGYSSTYNPLKEIKDGKE